MFRRFNNREAKPLSDHANLFKLVQRRPSLTLEGLRLGVDNVRYDVFLSPKFVEAARSFMARMLARQANVVDLAEEPTQASRPVSVIPRNGARNSELPDFKTALVQLLRGSLERAKIEQNPS